MLSCGNRFVAVMLVLMAVVISRASAVVDAADQNQLQEKIEKTRVDLKNADAAVRLAAAGSLIHSDISDKMLPEMREALKDSDGQVRSTIATAIGNLGAAAVPAIPQLVAQLHKDSVKEARETAARALGRIGKAAPAEKSVIAPLETASTNDADPVTRVVALGALAMAGSSPEDRIVSLRKYLHHEEALVRMKASHALGMLGAPARAAAAEIVSVLEKETDHHRRGYIARAVGNVGDPASLPALYAAYEKETDAGALGEMRGAISKLGGKVPAPKK